MRRRLRNQLVMMIHDAVAKAAAPLTALNSRTQSIVFPPGTIVQAEL
ncbi:MAG TPA: hypothetical protein VGC92_00905 [Phenylobacterium sp.]